MSIRTLFIIMSCFIFFLSCRDTKSGEDRDTLNTEENEFSPVDRNIPREEVNQENFGVDAPGSREKTGNSQVQEPNQSETRKESSGTVVTGRFIKKGEESDSNCGCYCLNLTTNTAELCLVNGKMYINTRLQRNSNNTIDVFLEEPAGRNTEGKEIPWKDFDRNNAIARITPKSNGELELDWLGFKINGDLAIDYALFGKKTLEGDYVKK